MVGKVLSSFFPCSLCGIFFSLCSGQAVEGAGGRKGRGNALGFISYVFLQMLKCVEERKLRFES